MKLAIAFISVLFSIETMPMVSTAITTKLLNQNTYKIYEGQNGIDTLIDSYRLLSSFQYKFKSNLLCLSNCNKNSQCLSALYCFNETSGYSTCSLYASINCTSDREVGKSCVYCPLDFTLKNGYCYYTDTSQFKNKKEARIYCEKRNANLLQIKNTDQYTFWLNNFDESANFHIGGICVMNSHDTVYKWTDDTILNSIPNAELSGTCDETSTCLGINVMKGVQSIVLAYFNCDTDTYRFVCEIGELKFVKFTSSVHAFTIK